MTDLSTQLQALIEERGEKLDTLDALVDKMAKQKRDFNKDEQRTYDETKKEIESISNRIEILREKLEREKKEIGGYSSEPQKEDEEQRTFQYFKKTKDDPNKKYQQFVLRNKNVNPIMEKVDVFKYMRALATGKTFGDRAISHAMDETRSVTGTGILNDYLSAQLWDSALPKTRLAQAGMQTIPLENGTHKIAKATTLPSFEWKSELSPTTERTAVFDNVTFNAKTLRGYCRISGELLMDGINTDAAIRRVMSTAAANEIDRAGLVGSGVGAEPAGLLNLANINEYDLGTNGAQITSHDPFIEGMKLVLEDSGPMPSHCILSPRTWATVAKFKEATTNAPMGYPMALNQVTFLETAQVPNTYSSGSASSTLSVAFLGGFDSYYLGTRLDTTVMVTPVVADEYAYDFLLAFRGDFQASREEDMSIITHILP